MHRIFLRIRNLLGRGCNGDMIAMVSASGDLTMHLCSGCGDWYISVRDRSVGKGEWQELPTKGVEYANLLRREGFSIAADELQTLAINSPQSDEEWAQHESEKE